MTRAACVMHERNGGHFENCLHCQRAEAGRLRLALRRIGSTEAFKVPIDFRPRGSTRDEVIAELHARMQYARQEAQNG